MSNVVGIKRTIKTDSSGNGSAKLPVNGFIVGARLVPAATTTPTLVVNDAEDIDLLDGGGAGISVKSRIPPGTVLEPVDEDVNLVISGGGDELTHKVTLYVASMAGLSVT